MEMNSSSLKNTARLAGLLYLLLIITGAYCVMYVPSQIIGRGDAVATANNILANEFLFRTGIISDLISNTIWVFLVMVLYRLFKQVNERQAKLLVALVIVQIPAVFIMEAFNITSLMIFKGEILKTFELSQRLDLAMSFLKINDYGTLTLEMFWGLWLIPFGLLVYKSGFIPRILGILLFIAGIAYMIDSFISLLFPVYHTSVNQPILLFVGIGEISIMLWLLIKGFDNETGLLVSISEIIRIFITILLLYWYTKYVVKLPLNIPTLNAKSLNMGLWILIGLSLPILTVVTFYITGNLSVRNIDTELSRSYIFDAILKAFGVSLASGFVEEIIFRGYFFNLLKSKYNFVISAFAPSLF